jgi:3-oxoacyl-[acyl-carrier-protein] synthase-3
MNETVIPHINMRGIAVALPHTIESNDTFSELLGHQEIERVSQTIGIHSRRVAEKEVTALDLMLQALDRLFETTGTDKKDIDCLVCVTQTPDHIIPGNSFLLCARLELKSSIFTLDINAGCAGFTHGLITLGKLLSSHDMQRGVLVVGDTLTRMVNPKDKTERLLFGDGAAACLLEFDKNRKGLTASWRTISREYAKLIVPAGGMRHPTTEQTKAITLREDGAYRSDNDLAMDGAAVFSFSIKEVPELVNSVLTKCKLSKDEIDLFVFHQANRFMVDYIRKKLKLNEQKVPICVEGIGNTSGASIPIAICQYAFNQGLNKLSGRLCLTGFGVGLALSSIVLEVEDLIVSFL